MALGSVSTALNMQLGDGQDALDFQAFVAQLTWPVVNTPACMLHASAAAAKVASRLERSRLEEVRARWKASLTRGKALAKTAYLYVKDAIGFTASPVGEEDADGPFEQQEDEGDDSQECGVDEEVGTLPLLEESPNGALRPVVRGTRPLEPGAAGPTPPVQPRAAAEALQAPLGLQAATEREANKWAELWAEEGDYEQPTFALEVADHPGPIHPWMIRAACSTFPADTGVGVDAIQPRALLRLSDEAIMALCRLLMAIELHGCWPELIRLVLIILAKA